MLTFYSNLASSNAQKVHFFLEHAKIPHTTKVVDLASGEQMSEAYRKINPSEAVPAIDHDGFLLAESNTILRYLAHKFEKLDMYPMELQARVKVDQMIDFATLHVTRWVQSLFWNTVLAPMLKRPVSQAGIEEAHMQLERYLPRLESRLAQSGGFLCGEKFTIADASFIPLVAQARQMQLDFSKHPATQTYAEHLLALPAWKKTADDIRKAFGS